MRGDVKSIMIWDIGTGERSDLLQEHLFVAAFQGFEEPATKRLAILNAAPSLDTLRALPINRLEVLQGTRAGQYSRRINRQWRICFAWPDGSLGPTEVQIADYH